MKEICFNTKGAKDMENKTVNSEGGGEGGQLLLVSFFLGEACFAFDTREVSEVLRVGDVTAVSHAPDYVLGVMNMRGRIATVMDLGVKLGLDPVEVTGESRIFVVLWGEEHVGLLADRMADVLTVETTDIKPVPENIHGVQSEQVKGVCHNGEHLVALLDLAKVLRA